MVAGGESGGFGPGAFVGRSFMSALDADKSEEVTKVEFLAGFDKWFLAWNDDKTGVLTGEQLRAGINQDLSPIRGGGPPGGPMAVPLPGPPPAK